MYLWIFEVSRCFFSGWRSITWMWIVLRSPLAVLCSKMWLAIISSNIHPFPQCLSCFLLLLLWDEFPAVLYKQEQENRERGVSFLKTRYLNFPSFDFLGGRYFWVTRNKQLVELLWSTNLALVGWLSWLVSPRYATVAGLIPSQGTYVNQPMNA